MTKRPAGSTTGVRAGDIAVIAAFAALIIVLGGVTVPVGGAGVPIVLQNMGIALATMILGWRRGGLAVLLFLGVGFLGVPNMAGWTPALSAVSGPTVGYIVGYAVVGRDDTGADQRDVDMIVLRRHDIDNPSFGGCCARGSLVRGRDPLASTIR
jgi:uncharacterized membrane protein